MSNCLQPHELQHARPPCPSLTPWVHSDSCPLSQWCHPAISFSVIPFSSCPSPSQHQSLFQWVNSSHEVAKILEFQNFPQFLVIHTVKGFDIVNKAEIDVFLELPCFFDDSVNVGNLISGSSSFSKTILNIWKLPVHGIAEAWLGEFWALLYCVLDEWNCVVVWAFFGIAFLWVALRRW